MYSIADISIQKYFMLEDTSDYDIFIDAIRPKNKFRGRKCKQLSFDEVEVIKRIFNAPNIEDIKDVFQTCYQVTGSFDKSADEEFWGTSIFELFKAKNYLMSYIEKIIERETNQLSGGEDDKMMMINAGERLKPVSHQLTKIRIGEQFGKSPKEIGRWNYSDVFSILVANKINGDLMKDYHAIK